MASPMPWIKVYGEILSDRKLLKLNRAARFTFIELIVLAGECDAEGDLIDGEGAMDTEYIAWRFGMEQAELVADMKALERVGLIAREDNAWVVCKFHDRQGRSQSVKREQWRQAQQRRRAAESGDESTHDNPNGVIHDTSKTQTGVIPLEERREEKSREDLSLSAQAHQKTLNINTKEPRIMAYIDLFGVIPNLEQVECIHAVVTDLGKWQAVIKDWKAHKWKPDNVPGMVDHYQTWGKPKPTFSGNGHRPGKLRRPAQVEDLSGPELEAARERARQRIAERAKRKEVGDV